jgi:hypothetical protein
VSNIAWLWWAEAVAAASVDTVKVKSAVVASFMAELRYASKGVKAN